MGLNESTDLLAYNIHTSEKYQHSTRATTVPKFGIWTPK
uniref:Uncharacterized protein n=1 Tax=Arundo donax TaxID=35708 RepID=A0A0A8XQY7_ARUDO